MPRSRSQHDSDSVSLFPFLAVLLCTMGALIVILVVIAQQARATAAAKAAADRPPPVEQPPAPKSDPAESEMLAWQVEQLQQSRADTAADMERARAELSGIEEHLRRLASQRDQLARKAGSLAETDEKSAVRREQLASQLAQLQQQQEALEREVAAARTRAQTQKKAYAIVPYEGPNRTRRRPLYIECRADSVVLQPEGVVLVESDFEPPLGPGNPLAAALRSAVDYCQQQNPRETPYPLVLVRPEGINAYYAVRKALSSWGSDFGYELIESDWNLDFPPTDNRLATVQRQAVEQGRRYQRQLAAAAPSRYGRRRPVYRASSSRGGFVQVPGSGGAGGDRDDGPFGSGGGRSGSGGPGPASEGNRGGSLAAGTGNSPGGSGTGGLGTGGTGPGGAGSGGTGQGAADRYAAAGSSPYDGRNNGLGSGGTAGGANAGGQGQYGGQGQHGGSAAQGGAGQSGRGQFAGGAGQASGQFGRPGQSGSGGGGDGNRPGGGGGGSARGQFGASGGAAGQSGGGSPQGAGEFGGQAGNQRHPAEARGENWALKNAARRATPLTRPVRVVCLPDRLVILPEAGDGQGRTVMLPGRTADGLDDFASAMWEHMDAWGIAGNGFYWRPLLTLQVGPQGGQRAQELRYLLQGSGLDVKQ